MSRHEKSCTNHPPSTGPTAGASSIGMPKIPMTRPMFWGPTARMMMVIPIGISMPPPSPWRTRKNTSSGSVCATPHAIEASVNRAIVTRYSRFVPKRSLAHPAIGMTAPCASMYPVTTHEMSA